MPITPKTGSLFHAETQRAVNSMALVEFPRMRTVVALRNRYAEDELDNAVLVCHLAGNVGCEIISDLE
jgi:hypothetical protein